jgi:hypothetical protein
MTVVSDNRPVLRQGRLGPFQSPPDALLLSPDVSVCRKGKRYFCTLLLYRCNTFFHGKLPKIGRRPNTTFERLVYRTLIIIFDTLDDILRWARPFDKGQEDRVRKINLPPSFFFEPMSM